GSGNMSPQSTMMISSPYSKSIMLRPISPRPPSGVIFRPEVSFSESPIKCLSCWLYGGFKKLYLLIAESDPFQPWSDKAMSRVECAAQRSVGDQRFFLFPPGLHVSAYDPEPGRASLNKRTQGCIHVNCRLESGNGIYMVAGCKRFFSPAVLRPLPKLRVCGKEEN